MKIEDLLTEPQKYHTCWFYCLKHKRPELGEWTQIDCRRIGPFESEGEAREVAEQQATLRDPERTAQRFHEAYERLAPRFGYTTRRKSAVPWEDVPEANRRLMVAVCAEVLGGAASSPDGGEAHSEAVCGATAVDDDGVTFTCEREAGHPSAHHQPASGFGRGYIWPNRGGSGVAAPPDSDRGDEGN